MAVSREKTAAELPEPRPDLLAVRLRDLQRINFFPPEKLESSLLVWRRQRGEFLFHREQKHQPMRLAFITVLADKAGQMQL